MLRLATAFALVAGSSALRLSPTHSLLPADPLEDAAMNQGTDPHGMDALQRQLQKHVLVLSHYMPPTTEKAGEGDRPARMPAGVRIENARPGAAALQDDKMPEGTERPAKPTTASMDASRAVLAINDRLEATASRSTHEHALFEAPQREPHWAQEGPAGAAPVHEVRGGVEIL